MIKMISSTNFNNSDSKAILPNDSDSPEPDDFAALLNGFSLLVPQPASLPVQNFPKQNNSETFAENQNFAMSGEGATQPLPNFSETIVLPQNFSEDLVKTENPALNQFLASDLAAGNNLSRTEDFAENIKSAETKNNSFSDNDLFAQIESADFEADTSKNFESELNSSENKQTELFSSNEKAELPNKLPKLFREVSSFFDASDLTAKTQQNISESVQKNPVESGNIAAQIEPQILQLAELAAKTGKPQILKMRLNPAELGVVEIKIEKDSSGNLNAHFQTEKEETRKILTENLPQLRDSLQDSGWQIERVEVSCGSFSFAGNEAREDSSQAFENAAHNSFAQTANSDGSLNNEDEANSEKSNRLLSVRA